ncbi:hypothetical protein BTVI_40225 [Pitangus sulphuratus]|nr:hypothetical protein BTVI_40225 [Pitangus sulphuratus]
MDQTSEVLTTSGQETVGTMARKLLVYEDTVNSTSQTQVSFMEKLAEDVQNLKEELNNQIKDSPKTLKRRLRRTASMLHQCKPELLRSERDAPQLGEGTTPHEPTCGTSYSRMEKTWIFVTGNLPVP